MAEFTGIAPLTSLGMAEDEGIRDQLAIANALRKKGLETGGQMVGNIYVGKNPWANFLEAAVGSGMAEYQRGQHAGLQESRKAQREQFLSQMPSATESREQMGPVQEGQEFLPNVDAPKPLRQYGDEMRRYGMQGLNIPGMEGIGMRAIQQAMEMPDKEAALQEQRAARQHELLIKAQEARALAEAKAEAELKRDRERAEDRKDLARPTVIATDQGFYTVNRDGKTTVPLTNEKGEPLMKAPNAGGKGGAPVEKAKQQTSDLLDKISMAEQGLSHASGFGTIVPAGIRQAYTSENTKIADASIAALSAEKAHELYGAAFTAAEQSRAAQFLPITTGPFPDTVDTIRAKLKALRIIAEKKDARLNGRPDPYPKMYNDILDPVDASPKPTASTSGSNDDAAARAWLAANPNHPRAAAVRQKLEGR